MRFGFTIDKLALVREMGLVGHLLTRSRSTGRKKTGHVSKYRYEIEDKSRIPRVCRVAVD